MTEGTSPRMTSHRPYLLRALYAWIADNGMTPHLLVDARRSGVQVPAFAVNDGKIVLNVAERAVSGLEMGNDQISFTARFGGVSHHVWIPISAVLAIYARETGQGMALPEDMPGAAASQDDAHAPGDVLAALANDHQPDGDDGDDHQPPTPRRSGHLRIVK
jgi:stringent starvation protein B